MKRMESKIELMVQMKDAYTKKLSEEKEVRSKRTEVYQTLVKTLLTTLHTYKKYSETLASTFSSSFHSLLLLVDYSFEAVKGYKLETLKLNLNPSDLRLLPSNCVALIETINEQKGLLNYEEIDKIYQKTVRELRGRKYLEDKESLLLSGHASEEPRLTSNISHSHGLSPIRPVRITDNESSLDTSATNEDKHSFHEALFGITVQLESLASRNMPGKVSHTLSDSLLRFVKASNQLMEAIEGMAGPSSSSKFDNILSDLNEDEKKERISDILAGKPLLSSDLQHSTNLLRDKAISISMISGERLTDGSEAELNS